MEFAKHSFESCSAGEFSDSLEEKYRLSENEKNHAEGLNYWTTHGATRFDLEPPRCRKASGAGLRLRARRVISSSSNSRVEELRYARRLEHCSAVIAKQDERQF